MSNSEDSSVSGKHADEQDRLYSEKANHSKAASQLEVLLFSLPDFYFVIVSSFFPYYLPHFSS